MQQQHHTRQMQQLRHIPPHTNNIQIHPAPPAQPPTMTNITTTATAPPNHAANLQTQNRANNHKHATSGGGMHNHNQTAQMQKIRQQHQHLNHKNNNNVNHNNNNIINKTQYGNHMNEHSHQQQQQSLSIGYLQQQQQHAQLHPNQQKNASHQYNNTYAAMNTNQCAQTAAALKQILPANATRPQPQQQNQQYGFNYAAGNKPKYNNNNHTTKSGSNNAAGAAAAAASTFTTPKTILQNPNRLSKAASTTTPTTTTTTPTEKTKTTTNDKETTNSSTTTSNVGKSAKPPPLDDDDDSGNENSSNSHKESSARNSPQKCETNEESNKENIANDSSEKSVSNHSHNNKILCNDDSIAKNTKEKTPMCLVNELARFNKITHQYRLTGEKGPAHSKRFTVTLKLGDEEYTAEGYKIKKAQHAAASQALEKTAYKHPIPKTSKNHDDSKPRPYIMPTVELNALAMKLGQQTYYLYDPRQMPTPPMGAADLHEQAAAMHDGALATQHFGGNGGLPPLPPHIGGGGHLMPLPPQQRHMLNEAGNFNQRRHFDAGGGYCGGGPLPPSLPPPPTNAAHLPNCPPQRGAYGPPTAHRAVPGVGGGAAAGNAYAMMNRYPRYPMIPPAIGAPAPPHGMPPHHHPHHHSMHHHHAHHAPHPYGMMPPNTPYKITLIVGKQKFIGTGRTLQHAKHDAASRALQVLKTQKLEEAAKDGSGGGGGGGDLDESMDENDVKSPISQVHEAGIKRNLTVHFKIIREEGPAHMRNFITACIMGTLVTEGEGHGKKISKKRAAEKMLLEIKKLPPVTVTPQKTPTKRAAAKGKSQATPARPDDRKEHSESVVRDKREKFAAAKERAKKIQNEIKEKTNEEDCPITRLLHLMQQRKQKEPLFEYIAKSEKNRKREFIVEVTAQGYAARGTGVNKKIAKRNAAENLLHTILEEENSSSDNDITEDQIELDDETEDELENVKQKSTPVAVQRNTAKDGKEKTKAAKFLHDLTEVSTTTGQVPGILILRQNKKPAAAAKKKDILAASTTSTPARLTAKANAKRVELKKSEVKIVEDLKEEATAQSVADLDEEEEEDNTEVEQIEQKSLAEKETKAATHTTTTTTAAKETDAAAAVDDERAEEATPAKVEKSNNASANSNSCSTNNSNNSTSNINAPPSLMKQQLLYLANLLGFEVNFSDFPKGNHNEFLTIVALSTDPPQMCHGFGQNTNESQNDAARNALKILSDLGLNNAKAN